MMLVLMCMLVASTLVVALLGALTSAVRPVAYERKATRTAAAAEAGLQAALGVVRGSISVRPLLGLGGDLGKLPCLYPTPLTGTVGGGQGGAAYAVTVRYFVQDPTGQSGAWRAANAVSCAAGSGPVQTPAYALLESAATAAASGGNAAAQGDRSQELVYTFSRSDAGVLGGLIRSGTSSTDGSKCWTSPASPPAPGDRLTMATCDITDPRQLFSYRSDYSLVLSASQASISPPTGGMCVSGDQIGAFSPVDGSGNGNDAIVSGSPTWGAVGPVSGSGVTLDGITTYLQTTTSYAAPAQNTVSVWFRTTTGGGHLLQYGSSQGLSSANFDRQLYLSATGALVWGIWTGTGQTLVSPGTYLDGAWHLAVASVGGAGMALYVDGTKVASRATPTTGQPVTGYWHIGSGAVNTWAWPASTGNGFFTGSLAHVSVWNAQLSDAQVSQMAAQSTYSGYQSTLLALAPAAYWALGGSDSQAEATFRACDSRPHQRWSYNDYGQFQLERYDATALSGLCLNAADVLAAPLVVRSCSGTREWAPDTTVGAGAAGAATGQLVNYAEFGRCLDVTAWNVNYPWLIAYPCKQDPTRPVGGNQRFTYDTSTSRLWTNFGANYCLTSAGYSTGRVLTKACGSVGQQTWTVNQDTGVRATSYTIVDGNGLCMALGPPGTTSGGLSLWSSITVATCDGSYAQKWNAPPQLAASTVNGQRETTGGR
jgi:hypothetical protein